MPCPDPGPGADFFNNVAAVAVVLMFAKVVSHRSRKADYNPKWAKRLAHAHVAAVLLAVAAVVHLPAGNRRPSCGHPSLVEYHLGVVGPQRGDPSLRRQRRRIPRLTYEGRHWRHSNTQQESIIGLDTACAYNNFTRGRAGCGKTVPITPRRF